MASAYYQTFSVVGRSAYPIDMMRYDSCFPADQDSTMTMQGEKCRLNFARITSGKPTEPTIGRWASFGWTVDKASIRSHKIDY